MKKIVTMAMFGFTVISGVAQAGEIGMWRESEPIVKNGKYYSVILDRGELKKAVKGSDNTYHFSEKGAGVKSLVLIGSASDVSEFMFKNATSGIDNDIKELPDIYIGVAPYRPEERFSGLFPLYDLVVQTAGQVTQFIPGSSMTDSAGIPADLQALHQR
ncbi:TPA: hypothetical protein H2S96_004284 [Salmonella enterica]|uniref:hypothetical protein n=1 Tax=Salmonella enterica TaxID=28901 RepID=UPI0019CA1371|nr:hypothetical protein [Salmonella enterica]MDL2989152.1 hypothetical protein [Salmonella enterica]HAK6771612.1 hypothetical protein [Salmonella enterica]HAK6818095.1 hypothetical protein [Salmonella enterica]